MVEVDCAAVAGQESDVCADWWECAYKELAELLPQPMFELGMDTRITFGNRRAAEVFGYGRADVRSGVLIDEVIAPHDLTRARECVRDVLRGGKVVGQEYEFVRKDGSTFAGMVYCSPIRRDGMIVGARGIVVDISERRSAEERLRESLGRLRHAFESAIQALALTVEMRDPYTSGHQRQVARLARGIACEMELADDRVDAIYLTAMVHDIGKICVPAEILSKPGRMTKFEFGLITAHPQVGCNILRTIEFPWPIAEIVLQHHERMNGTGYPMGLSDGEILLEARILGVADVVEAMASHRPYRPALGIDKALEEIVQQAGVLYDENVVAACLRVFRERGFAFG